MIPSSMVRVKALKWVFRHNSQDEQLMQIQFARMCVLYEDLRVEYEGAQADGLGALDTTSVETRRFYFVRRTLGTVWEMRQAIGALKKNPAFQQLQTRLDAEAKQIWSDAEAFFEQQHDFLKAWRNDVGGHFLDAAAAHALDAISADTVGVCELYRRGNGADVRMKFAFDLVAVAMSKNKDRGTETDYFHRGFEILVEANRHVRDTVHVIVYSLVWPRFGGA